MADERLVYNFLEDGAAYLNAVESGETIEITRDTFDYFLEVLPPVCMRRTMILEGQSRNVAFGFAEGSELITAFWTEKVDQQIQYFCKRTHELNRL